MANLKDTQNKEFKEIFYNTLKKSNRPPFMFIGSGISINYCGIPTWKELLKGFVEENKGCFKYDFGYYSSKCSSDLLKIASKLSNEFHEYWWKSNEYKDRRKQFGTQASLNPEMAFKIELASYVEGKQKIKEELENEINLMKKAVVSGILTTNWDNFLQNIFPDFNTVIGQKETIFSDQKSIGEIYKIHGCVSKPDSLVVTENDYEEFIKNNHYLNAKLLTLFIEYPIVFIGYSLNDPNIEAILLNLISCLDEEMLHSDKLKNRLFFIEWQSSPCDPTIEISSHTLSKTTLPIQKIKLHNYSDVWEVLANLPRTLPVSLIRQLQNMVYDFVTNISSSTKTNKILVNGIEQLKTIEDLEVVVGFGNISKIQEKGIVGLEVKDLIEDILFETISIENYQEIAQNLLPRLITKGTFCPFFKYHKIINNLNNDNSLKKYTEGNYTLERAQNIGIKDYQIESQRKSMVKKVSKYPSLDELVKESSFIHSIQRIPYLEISKIEPKLLRNFLKENWNNIEKYPSYSSTYRKCVCLLDYIENAIKPK